MTVAAAAAARCGSTDTRFGQPKLTGLKPLSPPTQIGSREIRERVSRKATSSFVAVGAIFLLAGRGVAPSRTQVSRFFDSLHIEPAEHFSPT